MHLNSEPGSEEEASDSDTQSTQDIEEADQDNAISMGNESCEEETDSVEDTMHKREKAKQFGEWLKRTCQLFEDQLEKDNFDFLDRFMEFNRRIGVAFAPDALVAEKMSLGVGGKQPKMRDTWDSIRKRPQTTARIVASHLRRVSSPAEPDTDQIIGLANAAWKIVRALRRKSVSNVTPPPTETRPAIVEKGLPRL